MARPFAYRVLSIVFAFATVIGCANRPGPTESVTQCHTEPLALERQHSVLMTVVTTNSVFFVGGEVRQPGRFAWTNGLTLTQAIQMAGGFTQFASPYAFELRRENGSVELFNYTAIAKGRTNNPTLEPNDQVYI